MTISNDKDRELLGQERRRLSPEQKLAMVPERLEPGQSVLVVVRHNGINVNQLFLWRKLYQGGSLSTVSAGDGSFKLAVPLRRSWHCTMLIAAG